MAVEKSTSDSTTERRLGLVFFFLLGLGSLTLVVFFQSGPAFLLLLPLGIALDRDCPNRRLTILAALGVLVLPFAASRPELAHRIGLVLIPLLLALPAVIVTWIEKNPVPNHRIPSHKTILVNGCLATALLSFTSHQLGRGSDVVIMLGCASAIAFFLAFREHFRERKGGSLPMGT
jgi:hypothetical protein